MTTTRLANLAGKGVGLAVTDRREGLTMRLAEYVAGLKCEDLPPEVVEKAKYHIRDGIGNQIAASAASDPARAVVELVQSWGGKEESTIVGFGDRVPIPHAALCNAMMGHGVELDDAHDKALTKAGSVLVPTTMAVAEAVGASGKETIAAIVAGYDVAIRIGLTLNPSHRRRGFHTTGTASAFGAAAVTAKLLGADARQVAYALGLAGMQAAGIQAFLDDPCMAKPFSPGKAAFNGVLAGLMASRDFSGPTKVLESKEGFLNAYADEVNIGHILDTLGSHYIIMDMGFKPHAACRYAHTAIDIAQDLKKTHDVAAGDVEKVTLRVSELALRQAGRVDTPNLNTSMGSARFGVALAFTRGENGLVDYWEGFNDPTNHELARKVDMVTEDEFGVMGRQTIVEVELKDGRKLVQRREEPKGEPTTPLTPDELRAKFLGLAEMVISPDQARSVDDHVMRLEELDDVSVIPPMTQASGRAPKLLVG